MSVVIEARDDSRNWNEAVRAVGETLPAAVRSAVRKLGLGPGRTLASERVGESQYRYNWSGKTIHVVVQPTPRQQKSRTVTLSDAAWERLGELAGEGGSRSAVVERLVLTAAVGP